VVVGPDELASGEVTLRDMSTREEKRVALDAAPAAVAAALG
jgi:histidyl-tRNA synthetase